MFHDYIEPVFSILASAAALFAAFKSHRAENLVKAVLPSYHKVTSENKMRLRFSGLFGSPVNANADANTVSDKIDGLDGAGNQLPYRKFAFGFRAKPFGLALDYAFPEGQNVSSSMADAATSLVKLLGRKYLMPDGNEADALDMIYYAAKKASREDPSLMIDELHSVTAKLGRS